MKRFLLIIGVVFTACNSGAQELVALPFENVPNVEWQGGEKSYFSDIWNTQVITNISEPSMEVFRAPKEKANGTAVVIAPGGALYGLSIESEGNQVARWLNERGITAFVLRYRLVPTGKDGIAEVSHLGQTNPQKIEEAVLPVLPYSIKDGLTAITHIRKNASDYAVNPAKIGFMGFSAGGAVTMGVAENYSENSKPNFVVPVYPWTTVKAVSKPREDAPPLLVVCASDDPLDLAGGSIELYTVWLEANKSAALHMYSKGGHGFGMRKNGLPSDNWIFRFYDWAIAEGLTTQTTPN